MTVVKTSLRLIAYKNVTWAGTSSWISAEGTSSGIPPRILNYFRNSSPGFLEDYFLEFLKGLLQILLHRLFFPGVSTRITRKCFRDFSRMFFIVSFLGFSTDFFVNSIRDLFWSSWRNFFKYSLEYFWREFSCKSLQGFYQEFSDFSRNYFIFCLETSSSSFFVNTDITRCLALG